MERETTNMLIGVVADPENDIGFGDGHDDVHNDGDWKMVSILNVKNRLNDTILNGETGIIHSPWAGGRLIDRLWNPSVSRYGRNSAAPQSGRCVVLILSALSYLLAFKPDLRKSPDVMNK